MTLRERLADWLTGGALTKARWERDMAKEAADHVMTGMMERFARIAACETPGANATVRRMAKMAREAVE